MIWPRLIYMRLNISLFTCSTGAKWKKIKCNSVGGYFFSVFSILITYTADINAFDIDTRPPPKRNANNAFNTSQYYCGFVARLPVYCLHISLFSVYFSRIFIDNISRLSAGTIIYYMTGSAPLGCSDPTATAEIINHTIDNPNSSPRTFSQRTGIQSTRCYINT